MSREKLRSISSLKEIWVSLLEEDNIKSKEYDDDYQGMMMLLETALHKAKCLSNLHFNLRASNERVLSELKWKTQECNELKVEVVRLENAPCQKCSSLENELRCYKKKAAEAQSRIKSIAHILRLGENLEESQSPRKNSALTLVSQMLLEESPKRKKRCLLKTSNLWKETVINDVDLKKAKTVIHHGPEIHNVDLASPVKRTDCPEIITSPEDDPTKVLKSTLTLSLPNLNKASPCHAKKNLSTCFEKSITARGTDPLNNSTLIIPETEQSSAELNSSLADYVQEANSELDKIWFNTHSSKSLPGPSNKNEITLLPPRDVSFVDGTPEKSPHQKTKTKWKLRELKGPSEHAGKKKLRQMTLSLTNKQKAKEVDLSKMCGFDGGSVESSSEDSQPKKNASSRQPSEEEGYNVEAQLDAEAELFSEENTNAFKPLCSSTQKADLDLVSSKEKKSDSPDYKYKRGTVRRKSERAKLDGWDCTKCAEYYAACGETSPSKVKARLNKCSRHRDKFKAVSNTPPGYWNPIFPDTEECREQRMYTSYHCQKDKL